jgi:hypothetical protein
LNVVGLGQAGCRIAEAFDAYPQYSAFKIDADIEGENCYNIPKCNTAEEYEEVNFPGIGKFLEKIKGETLFIVGGSGTISCASLRILHHIRDNTIKILYVKPDIELLGEVQEMQERVVGAVLQEYTRSGVFEEMYIVSNKSLNDIIGGAPIIGYYDRLNELLVPTIHMINVFNNTEPVFGRVEKPRETHRILTIGLYDTEKDEEKMFFPLDNVRHRCYIYGINEEKLKSDGKLLNKITKQMKAKPTDSLKTNYIVHSTDYEYDIGYIIERTPHVQIKTK